MSWLIRIGAYGGHGSSYYLNPRGAVHVTGSPWAYLTACEHCAYHYATEAEANARARELRAASEADKDRGGFDTFEGFSISTIHAWNGYRKD